MDFDFVGEKSRAFVNDDGLWTILFWDADRRILPFLFSICRGGELSENDRRGNEITYIQVNGKCQSLLTVVRRHLAAGRGRGTKMAGGDLNVIRVI